MEGVGTRASRSQFWHPLSVVGWTKFTLAFGILSSGASTFRGKGPFCIWIPAQSGSRSCRGLEALPRCAWHGGLFDKGVQFRSSR